MVRPTLAGCGTALSSLEERGGGWTQSGYDPCYFFKVLSDGTRADMVLYVDDGYFLDSGSALADAELARLHERFTIDVKDARFFLGNNVSLGAP